MYQLDTGDMSDPRPSLDLLYLERMDHTAADQVADCSSLADTGDMTADQSDSESYQEHTADMYFVQSDYWLVLEDIIDIPTEIGHR
jgi:hypothetical protein